MATNRDQLIRTCFEARRDVRWWEIVEPNLRDNGFDADEINSCRQTWNEVREKTDWPQWQKEATRFSDAVLEDMRTTYFDRLDVVVIRLMWDKAANEREKFRQVLAGKAVQEEKPQALSQKLGREM
jgi:hypothetical protein